MTAGGHVPTEPSPGSKLSPPRSLPNASFGPYAALSVVGIYEGKFDDVAGVH